MRNFHFLSHMCLHILSLCALCLSHRRSNLIWFTIQFSFPALCFSVSCSLLPWSTCLLFLSINFPLTKRILYREKNIRVRVRNWHYHIKSNSKNQMQINSEHSEGKLKFNSLFTNAVDGVLNFARYSNWCEKHLMRLILKIISEFVNILKREESQVMSESNRESQWDLCGLWLFGKVSCRSLNYFN